jgi:hypothetical protein
VTQDQARAEAQRRNADPAEAGFWAARRTPVGTWRVVCILGPGLERRRPTRARVPGALQAQPRADARVSPPRDGPPAGA